jgi:23S rRNA (uracil1939-C5)-methyltransferase
MPRCPVFGECGGCQLQHLDYEHQLIWKTQRVADLLRGAGLVSVPIEPTLGCAEPWQYRNQMRFSVDRAGQPGLTAQGTHRVLPLRTCPIAHPLINRALGVLSASPCARPQLLVRCGAATGHVLIQPAPDVAQLERLTATGLDIHTETLNDALCVAIDPVGQDGGHEQHAEFRIRPSSFFQTNTAQANRMVTAVLAGLPSGPGVTLVDAYCGVGTFAALLAPHADTVLAIEESASAVRDAQWNLRHYPNVQVLQAKTELILPQLSQALDGLVIDPPRAGCQRPVLDSLRTRKVSRVVYVSCNPETLVRDLAYLCLEDVYRIRLVQPLDMFPQTAHIETIVTLEAT